MTDPRDPLRAELTRLLAERGCSYYRVAIRYDWQLGWDSRRDANPPDLDSLTLEQLEHLTCLVRDNVRVKQ